MTSVAPAMPAPITQLPEAPTIMATSTAGSSSSEGNPPIPWTDDEWNHIVTLVDDLSKLNFCSLPNFNVVLASYKQNGLWGQKFEIMQSFNYSASIT